jgi:disulfide bond formation protein DsbB
LYYQYAFDEWPCVVCIQIRLWNAGLIVVSALALLLQRFKSTFPIFHLLNSIIMVGFVERSWQVLAVERGWIFGDCSMDLGLPSWFAIDKWFPTLFEVQTTSGYTPLLIAKITMTEVLMDSSTLFLVASLALIVASFWRAK